MSLSSMKEKDAEETKRSLKWNEEKDNQFLIGKKDVEDEPTGDVASGWAHAPYWPGVFYFVLLTTRLLMLFGSTVNHHGGSSSPTTSRTGLLYRP